MIWFLPCIYCICVIDMHGVVFFQVFVEGRCRKRKKHSSCFDVLSDGTYMNVCHHACWLYINWVHILSAFLLVHDLWFPTNVLNSNYPQCDLGFSTPNTSTSTIQFLASVTRTFSWLRRLKVSKVDLEK